MSENSEQTAGKKVMVKLKEDGEAAREAIMILVLFEVTVKSEGFNDYLALAAGLKDELARTDGCLSAERFRSLVNEGKLLSLSVWENEPAVEKWRNTLAHRLSQRQGRESLFAGYTITVASKLRSYTATDRTEAPEDSNRFFASSLKVLGEREPHPQETL